MGDPLAEYPVVVEYPVGWGDMDAFSHVNNTLYFRWFEHARMAFFEAAGVVAHMESTGVGPILAHTQCRFRRAVAWPDRVRIGARVVDLGEDRFLMKYRVVSEALDDVAAEGDGTIVMFDYEKQRKASIPPEIRAAFERLDDKG